MTAPFTAIGVRGPTTAMSHPMVTWIDKLQYIFGKPIELISGQLSDAAVTQATHLVLADQITITISTRLTLTIGTPCATTIARMLARPALINRQVRRA